MALAANLALLALAVITYNQIKAFLGKLPRPVRALARRSGLRPRRDSLHDPADSRRARRPRGWPRRADRPCGACSAVRSPPRLPPPSPRSIGWAWAARERSPASIGIVLAAVSGILVAKLAAPRRRRPGLCPSAPAGHPAGLLPSDRRCFCRDRNWPTPSSPPPRRPQRWRCRWARCFSAPCCSRSSGGAMPRPRHRERTALPFHHRQPARRRLSAAAHRRRRDPLSVPQRPRAWSSLA